MQSKFNFSRFFLGFWLFSLSISIFSLNAFAEESLRLNLNQELKKGNLLIGLKG